MHYGRFLVTTPIYYVNDSPHIGHAYSTIAADILARYWKGRESEVFFLTGTDEHGMKITQAACKACVTPKEFVDQISDKYKEAWQALNINYTNFIRTTDPEHEKFVQDFVQKLYDNGDIYPDKYEGLYCVGCEEYKKEEDLEPGNICPLHKKVCETVEEDIYFFKLSKYQNQILEAIQSGKFAIEPESRRNEIFKFLAKEPLRDLALSRSKVEWGVPLPWDTSQTIYVWVDALLNYLSGSKGFWPPQLQIIAKDIFRFHAIIWPAMLLAAGYELPEKLFIHGYFTINGQKMSKSLGNAIDPVEIAKVYGEDALRYFLMREVPFGADGDFSLDRFDQRYRADLANDLGNLLQRVIVMAKNAQIKWKYAPSTKKYPDFDKAMEELKFHEALALVWKMITEQNVLIDAEKPWVLAKTDPARNEKLLSGMLDVLVDVAGLIEPFMPKTTIKMVEQLQSGQPEPLFPRKK
jgi:methionyl-tRNA synthetase